MSSERVLLVEGGDDEHVVRHLCHKMKIDEPCIIDKGGFPELARAIGVEIKVPNRHTVGILADADDDLDARWKAISGRLKGVNIELPMSPVPTGTLIDGKPRVGVWLMPDNVSAGEIEDFVATMIPAADPVWPLAEQYIEGIPPEHRKFKPGKVSRARIHAWLATRAEPRKMGAAIGAGDLASAQAECFTEWLRTLFDQ